MVWAGGQCITSRDCFNYNGTCAGSKGCQCLPDQQGSFCQLYRPAGKGGIQSKVKRQEFRYDPKRDPRKAAETSEARVVSLPKPPPTQVR